MLTLRRVLCWLLGHDPAVIWVGLRDGVPRGHCLRCGKDFEASHWQEEVLRLRAQVERLAHDAELWQFAVAEEGSFWAEEIAKSLAYMKDTKEEAAEAAERE